MWRQAVAGLIGVMLTWTPTNGFTEAALYGNTHPVQASASAAPESRFLSLKASRQTQRNGAIRRGEAAVFLALEQVIQALTDAYYQKYGGLFVTRRSVEYRVRKEIGEKQDTIARLLKEEYHCNDVPIQFNPKTSEVTYLAPRGLRTITIREIVDTIIQFREKPREDR